MEQKVLTIFDTKAEAYLRPFFAQSSGSAIRSFMDEINNSKTPDAPLAMHPEDYVLFEIGSWDEKEGLLRLNESKKSLGCGIDFKKDN